MSNIWIKDALNIAPAVAVGITIGMIVQKCAVNSIPPTVRVQQGYVIPSKLEIELRDLDGNGQREVLMKYDGKDYLLTLDKQGRPKVQAYEIKPAEVLIKE